MINFNTGSNGPGLRGAFAKGVLDDAHAGIVFRGGLASLAVTEPPPLTASPDEVQAWSDAVGLINFLMYALDQEEWMREWVDWELAMSESIAEALDRDAMERRRAGLTLIKGGKGETPTENGGDES